MPGKEPQQQRVTVEDLLQVKRAERPSDAFWGEFDRQWKARTMQELATEKSGQRQWLRRLRLVLWGLAPIASTAVVVLALIAWSTPEATPSAPVAHALPETARTLAEVSATETADETAETATPLTLPVELTRSAQFVVDAFHGNYAPEGVVRVSTPATFRATQSSAVYVDDRFTSAAQAADHSAVEASFDYY